MPRAYSSLVIALVLAAACERGADPEQTRHAAGQALRGALTYPRSSLVSVTSGEEAAQIVMTSPDSVAAVAAWFQQSLRLNKWDVKRTVDDHRGTVTIYAEQGKRPLWLTLRPNVGGAGTTYTMVGVIPMDSTVGRP
ncbi:MAG: hypothetical protein ABR537_02470 [Gemmatimonadales bacterium]